MQKILQKIIFDDCRGWLNENKLKFQKIEQLEMNLMFKKI